MSEVAAKYRPEQRRYEASEQEDYTGDSQPTHDSPLTVSLSGRQTQFAKRREHILFLCARGAFSLTLHGRSKHC